MTPQQIRDSSFESLRSGLEPKRRAVYAAWARHGPGTTRQVAAAAGINLLTFRPRTTELLEVGLVELVGRAVHEGIYRARNLAQWEHWRAARLSSQLVLPV
jgi:hypothetical protein